MTDWINEIVPRVKSILGERRQQGVPTATIRGIFYILVSEGLIENLPTPYKKLSEALVTARRKAIIPYEWITDENREIINVYDEYIRPGERITRTLDWLIDFPEKYISDYLPRWYKQPKYVECWVEKNAMAGVMSSILTQSRQVRVVPNGGWSSETFKHDNLERIRRKKWAYDYDKFLELEKKHPNEPNNWAKTLYETKVIVLYYGDYDPTGSRMVDNIQSEVESEGATFERVAITEEQIRQYNLEHLKTNMTEEVKAKLRRDPNAAAFMDENNGELFQIELDALNALSPGDFITLLENSVDQHFDESAYQELISDKKYSPATIKRQLHKAIKNFSKLEELRKKQLGSTDTAAEE